MDKKNKCRTDYIRPIMEKTMQQEHTAPIFATSGFLFQTAEEAAAVFNNEIKGNIYSRQTNPNNDELTEKLCILESIDNGVVTSSGMAAVFLGIYSLLQPGDHIISGKSIFGTTHLLFTKILSKWGISHTYVSGNNRKDWEEMIMPNTKMIFAETPSNPMLDITDLSMLGKICDKNGLFFVVDNTFATPYLQNPVNFGADIVIHSATKYIDGQGRFIAGAVLCRKNYFEEIKLHSNIIGTTLSPFTSWMLSKSLETLPIRMEAHCKNAGLLASFLENSAEVEWVRYPFLKSHPGYKTARKQMKYGGGMVSFALKGGEKDAMKFMNSLKMVAITANLGDTHTTATHPATTTHFALTDEEKHESGISSGMIRISVGLEEIEDIIDDFRQALISIKH